MTCDLIGTIGRASKTQHFIFNNLKIVNYKPISIKNSKFFNGVLKQGCICIIIKSVELKTSKGGFCFLCFSFLEVVFYVRHQNR